MDIDKTLVGPSGSNSSAYENILPKDSGGLTLMIPILTHSYQRFVPCDVFYWRQFRTHCLTSSYCLVMDRRGFKPISAAFMQRKDAPWIGHQLVAGFGATNPAHSLFTPKLRCTWDPYLHAHRICKLNTENIASLDQIRNHCATTSCRGFFYYSGNSLCGHWWSLELCSEYKDPKRIHLTTLQCIWGNESIHKELWVANPELKMSRNSCYHPTWLYPWCSRSFHGSGN